MAKPVVAGDRFSGRPAGSLRTGPQPPPPSGLPGRECYLSSRSKLLPILPVVPGYEGQRLDERKTSGKGGDPGGPAVADGGDAVGAHPTAPR